MKARTRTINATLSFSAMTTGRTKIWSRTKRPGVGGVTYIKYAEEMGQSLALPTHRLDFRYVASFRHRSALESTAVENLGQLSHFSQPVKIRGGVGDMSEAGFKFSL